MKTYSIYRIVCFSNARIYIGQTGDIRRRKWSHFSNLKHNRHENKHLQAAYNKYGRDSFYFEVLEEGLSVDEVDNREQFWIEYFDCCNNGFNQTIGGVNHDGGYFPVIWNGVEYRNCSVAARELGISYHAISWRKQSGYTSDNDLKGREHLATKCTWNGVDYPSISDAAKANGVTPTAMKRRLDYGHTSDSDLKEQERPCEWNGIKYQTLKSAATAINIPCSTLRLYLRRGYKSDDDLINRPPIKSNAYHKPCTWNGINYGSVTEAARANNISRDVLYQRLNKGQTCDADLKKWMGIPKPCTWNGIDYPTIKAAAQANGMTLKNMSRYLSKGYTCDDDLKSR